MADDDWIEIGLWGGLQCSARLVWPSGHAPLAWTKLEHSTLNAIRVAQSLLGNWGRGVTKECTFAPPNILCRCDVAFGLLRRGMNARCEEHMFSRGY